MFTSYFPKSFKKKNTLILNCNFLNTSNIQNSNILCYFSFYNFLQLINYFLKIVFGSLNHYDWVQLGGAIKHPENGKIIDMAPAVEKELKIKNP